MKKKFASVFAVTVLTALAVPAVHAEQIEISSSLNPVGSGARATGMGGAFIAVADDATAASWNPGGLVQLEKPEFSVVYSYFKRNATYSAPLHPEFNKDQSVDLHELNYASFAYPFQAFNKNMIVSVNYQRMFELDKTVNTPFIQPISTIGTITTNEKFSQKGYLSTITPAVAVQVIPELYLGAAVNIWNDFLDTNSWKSSFTAVGTQSILGTSTPLSFVQKEKTSFNGINYTIGALSNLGKVTVGAVVKTPFQADLTRTTYTQQASNFTVAGTTFTKQYEDMNMPMSYGAGVSYRFSDNLTVAADVYRTLWSDYTIESTTVNGVGVLTRGEFNPLTGLPIAQGRLKDTTQVKLGAEYLVIQPKYVIPVRVGVFYDPQPGYTASVDAAGNLLTKMTIDDYFGFSVGSGVTIKNWSFDVSYQFRKGDKVSSEIVEPNLRNSVTQHTVSSSLIYRF